MKITRISFVWNADFNLAGGINAIKEVVSGVHSCTLCEIAYHRVTQTREWKAYCKALAKRFGADIRQPCRNQLSAAERAIVETDFPAVLAHTDEGIVKLLGAVAIDGCDGDFQRFQQALDAALETLV